MGLAAPPGAVRFGPPRGCARESAANQLLVMIELSYRFPSDLFERPDQTETVHECDEAATRDAIITAGGKITGSRRVDWRESLARMETPEL